MSCRLGGKEERYLLAKGYQNTMDIISMIFLGASGIFFVSGVILLFTRDKKSMISKIEADYPERLKRLYYETGSIEETLTRILDEYEDNKYMCTLIERAVAYLNGDYGDYETALGMVNVTNNKEIEEVNEEILNIDRAKRYALPMK